MHKPIYSSEEHKSIVEVYVSMCKEFVQDITTQSRLNNYLEVIDVIMEYSNAYGEGTREEKSFYDWLMIIPINVSVATNGFFAGVETKSNAASIRACRLVLEQLLRETANRLDGLEPRND
tara:strand:- start:667 stop:1026 length:360 start_codon:yes stop_codon:yes gene_type:complete